MNHIRGEDFPALADFVYNPKDNRFMDKSCTIFSTIGQVPELLKKVSDSKHKYVLITHRPSRSDSDGSVTDKHIEIASDNIVKWFAVNANVGDNSLVECLPIGLPNKSVPSLDTGSEYITNILKGTKEHKLAYMNLRP